MKRLYKGIHAFQEAYFKKEEDFFRRLSGKQEPGVLFITCADSRIDPNLVTQSRPGELFIVRNVGNIIPSHEAIKDKNSVAAAIEFAVLRLKVTDIIICGHSNCGAMEALYRDDKEFVDMPHLKEWLKIALPVKEAVQSFYPEYPDAARQEITEKENILAQIENIQTYPSVAESLKRGDLYLHGWYYDIGKGEVHTYNPYSGSFEKIEYGYNTERT